MRLRPRPLTLRWHGAGLCLALLLGACASGPPAPEWQAQAHSELQTFSQAYLRGNSRVAAQAFSRARSETASTGQAEQVARAELTRCAVQVASLVLDDCPGYLALAADSSPASRAYAQYLSGRWDGLDAAQLPEQHRALVLQASRGKPAAEVGQSVLSTIADPLARLVAAGALLRSGRLTPADIETATETAAAQGWRRPLLAWLGVQRQRASPAADGAPAEVARIQRRIDLVLQAGAVE
jgi:hypothetical protein